MYMEEYKVKQLMDQEGKLIDAYASGDMEMVERKFNAIAGFILKKETEFEEGIEKDKVSLEKRILDAEKKFADGIRKAAEIVEDKDLILDSFKCFNELHETRDKAINEYPYKLVESVSSYTKTMVKRLSSNIQKP